MKLEKSKIRNGWQTVKLGELCVQDREIIEARSTAAQELSYLSLEHIFSGSGEIIKDESLAVEDEGRSSTFAFDKRHVLYGKLRPYLNKVALPDFAGRCTTELIPLLPKPETDREFLAWMLRRQETVAFAMQGKTGSRMPRADMDELMKMEVPFVPHDEQRRIAARLREQMAEVEQARAAVQAQLDAAQSLPAALLRAVFEGGKWEWIRVDELAETCSGTTPSRGRQDFYSGKIPWVKTGELVDGVIHDTEEHVTETAVRETSLRLLPKDTLLIAMYGQGQTRGRTALLACEATTNQACFAILPNEKIDPKFLQLWFQFSYARLRQASEGRGGNQSNFNGKVLGAEQVPLPSSKDEQRAIAARLDAELTAARALVETLETRLAEIELLPATLLHSAFNGNPN